MSNRTVTLIPPADLDVVGFGQVTAGQPVDVPVELAGEAPHPDREPAMAAHCLATAAGDFDEVRRLEAQLADLPAGHGLLAQGWQLAANKRKPAPDTPNATAPEEN